MNDIKKNLNMLGASLSLRAKRNEILASNIANAATPHFNARDIDFDTEEDHNFKPDYELTSRLIARNAPGLMVYLNSDKLINFSIFNTTFYSLNTLALMIIKTDILLTGITKLYWSAYSSRC